MLKKMNKKALSEMVSYVLLISIAIGISVGVYVWLTAMSNVEAPPSCEEDSFVVVNSYECSSGNYGGIDLVIENRGRFNISGIILSVGDDPKKSPVTYLVPKIPKGDIRPSLEGHFYFKAPLKPGAMETASYLNQEISGTGVRKKIENITFQEIKIIQIQPFIKIGKNKVVCKNAVLSQTIDECFVDPEESDTGELNNLQGNHCINGEQDQEETDVDCGGNGECVKCKTGQNCLNDLDCLTSCGIDNKCT